MGLLFQSWKAGGEGSAAILFDFDRNILEAVFEVLRRAATPAPASKATAAGLHFTIQRRAAAAASGERSKAVVVCVRAAWH